jgi:ADP-ribose pyrophosphatase
VTASRPGSPTAGTSQPAAAPAIAAAAPAIAAGAPVIAAGAPVIADVAEQWPVLDSVTRARSHIVALRTDRVLMPDGTSAERDVVVHPGAVGIVALDDDDRVLMIRQYRHPVSRLLWEIPAGLRDVDGEPLHRTAERELLEETGFRARTWHTLADYFSSPGISTERLRIFLARDVSEAPAAERVFVAQHEEAELELAWVPLEHALTLVLAGELHNGPAVVGILSAYAASRDGFGGLRPADAPER